MTNEWTLFGFEREFAQTLRCIPMAVRFKLDRCAVKLSIRQWARFNPDDRSELLTMPCEDREEAALYRARVVSLLEARTGEPAKELEAEPALWMNAGEVPEALVRHSRSVGVVPPDLGQWAALRRLQRYALLKLAREGHENLNFRPAMEEFGILDPETSAGLRTCGTPPRRNPLG